jgi:hypothetical protein
MRKILVTGGHEEVIFEGSFQGSVGENESNASVFGVQESRYDGSVLVFVSECEGGKLNDEKAVGLELSDNFEGAHGMEIQGRGAGTPAISSPRVRRKTSSDACPVIQLKPQERRAEAISSIASSTDGVGSDGLGSGWYLRFLAIDKALSVVTPS